RVPPNTFVHGKLTISYDTYYLDETVAYAGTTTWGDPEKAGYSFGVLSTPEVGRVRVDSIGFMTPAAPGTYHLVLVAGAESNADYLLSATNWTSGRPLWGDGNDVARWSEEKLAAAMRDGHVATVFRRTQAGQPPTYMQLVLAAAIRIIVDPSATRATVE
ncbi:MAG TPA: hypothetical protein VFV33_09075, partial [Gemmatimonadaceae bacterium]|nr:hypothetical protein [Gemmatimonadaceae bacterium]